MNRTSTLSVILLVSVIFTGGMTHAARPAAEPSAETSAAQGDDGAEQGYWQIWAAATAQ